ncbi:MAG: beta-phosphoglucomutase [Fibrobacteres bacterium]|nr:beta-phosphoglucomutase [Fibrobacterota bacterium]
MKNQKKAFIFDLDGVVTDTAEYHFQAWKTIADELNVPFDRHKNEELKGVSREESFKRLLSGKVLPPDQFKSLMNKKNDLYRSFLKKLTRNDMLPGMREFLTQSRHDGFKTAIGSSSKNAAEIIERLEANDLFDSIVCGADVPNAKPAPDLFLLAANKLNVPPEQCVVFEDAYSGITAAHTAGMKAVGIGTKEALPEADLIYKNLNSVTPEQIVNLLV